MTTYPWTTWIRRELLEWTAAFGLLLTLPWAHYHRTLAPELRQVKHLQTNLAEQMRHISPQDWQRFSLAAMQRMQRLVATSHQQVQTPVPDLAPVHTLYQTAPSPAPPPLPAPGPLLRLPHTGPEDIVWTAVNRYFHAPYRFGGQDVFGIDCSALVQGTFKHLGIDLPRTAQAQFDAALGVYIGLDDLRPGDLIFFHTRTHPYVSHVGIYLGNEEFLHAPRSGRRVEITPLTPYYKRRFIAAKRILADPFAAFAQEH